MIKSRDMTELSDTSLCALFSTYLLTEKMVAHNTLAAYKTDLQQFIDFLVSKEIGLRMVTIHNIRDFIFFLRNNQIGSRSTARKLSAIKLFFSYLCERYGFENCAKLIQFPIIEKKLPQYLSQQEVEDLLKATHLDTSHKGLRNQAIIYLLYATGMRISELAQLKTSNIDLQELTIILQGKGSKERIVPLPESISPLINRFISLELAKRKTHEESEVKYLFAIRYGKKWKPISRQALWHIIQQIWKKTGHARLISPHMLRHSMATHMLKNGAHLRSLQLILGHESLATVQIYTHVETSHVRQIYDKKHPRS